MDADEYGKRHYEGQRAARQEQRRRRRDRIPTKEIHLTVGIAEHDLEAKAAHARRLLAGRVNLRVSVDGVEPAQEALAEAVLRRFVEAVGDAADGVVPPQRGEGRVVAQLWSS